MSVKYYNFQSPLYKQEPYNLRHNKLGRLSYHTAAARSGHHQTGIISQAPVTLDSNQ